MKFGVKKKVTMPGAAPTKAQEKVLAYCKKHLCTQHRLPTVRELMSAFNWKSPGGAYCHLKGLHRKGLIEYTGRRGSLKLVGVRVSVEKCE